VGGRAARAHAVSRLSKGLFANRAWAFLGVVSYSLYLVHVPMIWYGRRLVVHVWPGIFPWLPAGGWTWTRGGLVAAGLLLATAVGLATLTYVTIERPMLRLKNRVAT
jgi:peptidoglycan/LPS O-acetylase OafA/YrhL